jgi:tetratricopeptide (TPR) repeat protein
MVYFAKREFEKALAGFNKAIELNPHDWLNYYSRGFTYWIQGEKTKAAADCQKAKEEKALIVHYMNPIVNKYCVIR